MKTYIMIRTVCFSTIKAELAIAYHLMKNSVMIILVDTVAKWVFGPFVKWLNYFLTPDISENNIFDTKNIKISWLIA